MSPAAIPAAFVSSAFDNYGVRTAPALALVVHVAEGGNTVNYLNDVGAPPLRGVSVHFVIERDGRIVQMLSLERISGSINPKDLRQTNDAPFTGYNGEIVRFGKAARVKVLGQWERNPNHACITVELEGFAAAGPNTAQRKALVLLSRDLAKRLPTIRGLLGHRDFTSRKACPGQHIPWANMSPTKRHG